MFRPRWKLPAGFGAFHRARSSVGLDAHVCEVLGVLKRRRDALAGRSTAQWEHDELEVDYLIELSQPIMLIDQRCIVVQVPHGETFTESRPRWSEPNPSNSSQ